MLLRRPTDRASSDKPPRLPLLSGGVDGRPPRLKASRPTSLDATSGRSEPDSRASSIWRRIFALCLGRLFATRPAAQSRTDGLVWRPSRKRQDCIRGRVAHLGCCIHRAEGAGKPRGGSRQCRARRQKQPWGAERRKEGEKESKRRSGRDSSAIAGVCSYTHTCVTRQDEDQPYHHKHYRQKCQCIASWGCRHHNRCSLTIGTMAVAQLPLTLVLFFGLATLLLPSVRNIMIIITMHLTTGYSRKNVGTKYSIKTMA